MKINGAEKRSGNNGAWQYGEMKISEKYREKKETQ